MDRNREVLSHLYANKIRLHVKLSKCLSEFLAEAFLRAAKMNLTQKAQWQGLGWKYQLLHRAKRKAEISQGLLEDHY
jgi:hypothetical protein